MIELEEKGYRFNPETRVWMRDDYQGLAYNDGDESEHRVARIIREAEDLSVLSTELAHQSIDWASTYHLDSARGNILRPFQRYLSGTILEIGSGCGAISRYLGECGGTVLSLEGSVRRAQITASRTRDLDNVTVLAERFDDFQTDQRFNVITLIGVLEYASAFGANEHPALHMLERAHDLLRPDGRLFIAIENQLGLKYFAGAAEDHVGVPMYGIEGRYSKGQVQTFGRKQLEQLIAAAGFDHSEFLYPAPDYKLPQSIITESGFESASFDAAALAWQSAKKDLQLPKVTTFNLERTWPVVIKNGLGAELANSFLVAASRSAEPAVPANVLAYHFNTSRMPAFCKLSRFVQTPAGIEVQHEPLRPESGPLQGEGFRHILSDVDPYVSGKPLSLRFLKIATSPDWMIQDFGLFVQQYLETLRELLSAHGHTFALERIDEILPGLFIDAVPQNILLRADGTPSYIDVEWDVPDGVELGHLLVRGLLLLIASATPFYPSIMPPTRKQFVLEILRAVGLEITDNDIHRYISAEARFQSFVIGRPVSHFLDWKPDAPINQKVPVVQAPLRAKLYYSNGDGQFTESASIPLELSPGPQQLHFPFASMPTKPRRLRFDPVDRKVSFAVDNVRLLDGERNVWEWDLQIESLVCTSGLMKVEKSGTAVFFLSLDDDPYLELPVDLSSVDNIANLVLAVDLVLYTDEVMARLVSVELNSVNHYQQALQNSLAPLTAQITALTQNIAELDGFTHSLAQNVSNSERDTASLVERLLVDHRLLLTQQIAELDKVTHGLADSVIETEHETIDTVERLLVDHRQILIQQMGQLDKVTHHLVEGVIATEQQTIDIVERLLGDHHDLTSDREAQIQQLQQALHGLQVEKDTHIHHLNLRIGVLESSYSRRLAAPVRKSIIAASRIKRVSKLLPAMIRRAGGFNATLQRSISVLREQGMHGLIARVRWFSGIDHDQTPLAPTEQRIERHDYAAWIERFDTLDAQGRWQITEDIRTWENQPLICIIMPVYNPPLDLLRAAVDSVRYQLYPHWELCIADDASTRPDVREYLEQLEQSDPQIKVVFREQNGHICAASNSAIELASGDYLALMDNDDLLAEHALYWVARAIVEHPDACLFYSDEDKIDVQGRRYEPYFKPDWNEFLFRSQNMVSHLGIYRRDLVMQVGGFREGFEGSQDYDLALRCIELISPTQIIHIPRVLYHWRAHPGSTAVAGSEKPYAALAGVEALNAHLQRTGQQAQAELLPMGMYRVRYELPEVLPLVSLIIPTRNAHGLVEQCIKSIRTLTTYGHYEIILVDNGSDDSASLACFAQLAQQPGIRVIRDDGPFNFSALNNLAVKQARGELVGLVNNDIEVITPQWLGEMVSVALQPGVGAVGARLWYPDDRLQHGGVVLGVGGVASHSHKFLPKGQYGYFGRGVLMQSFSAVTAACLVIRKSVYEQVHGLDEVNLSIAFNDVDFSLRLQEAGYTNVWTPFAELYHHESATRGLEDTPAKQARFDQEVAYMLQRWPDLTNDPAYNPNLTLGYDDFGLAWPPRI